LNSVEIGRLIGWEASLTAENAEHVRRSGTMRIVDRTNLTNVAYSLSIDADQDPVASDDHVTYTLYVGNLGLSNATDTTMTFTLPPEVTFVSATGNGAEVGGVVSWNLGTLLSGSSDRVQVTVVAGVGLPNGTLVESTLAVEGILNGLPTKHSASHLLFVDNSPNDLELAMRVEKAVGEQNRYTRIELTVANRSSTSLTGTTVHLDYPYALQQYFDDSAVPPVACSARTANGYCDGGEIATWTVGTLAPGEVRHIYMIPIASASLAGTVAPLRAWAKADNGEHVRHSRVMVFDEDTPFLLGVGVDRDPVSPGQALYYTISFNNQGGTNSLDTVLDFEVPEGTTFLAASDGGVLRQGIVSWDLGTLIAGAVDRVFVKVRVDGNQTSGQLIELQDVRIRGLVDGAQEMQVGSFVSHVETAAQELLLTQKVLTNSAQTDEQVSVSLELTNSSAVTMTGVQLRLRFPRGLVSTPEAAITDIVDCVGSVGSTRNCDLWETAVWDFTTIPAGETRSVAFNPTIADLPYGAVMEWFAQASADNGDYVVNHWTTLASTTLHVDSDGDGITDPYDNCPTVPNLDQADFLLDRRGDPCDPDDDEDGIPDVYENSHGFLNPWNPADGNLDEDRDGLTNRQEFDLGTEPDDADSDNDGIPDGYEAASPVLSPLDPSDATLDSDGDGFTNLQEYLARTDPNDSDSVPNNAAVITIIQQLLLE
jgi:uncharacterized repeat protein (TIGR01451 family)